MATTSKTTVILAGPDDWDEWLELVKTSVLKSKIWDYVNLELDQDERDFLIKPVRTTPGDIRANNPNLLRRSARATIASQEGESSTQGTETL